MCGIVGAAATRDVQNTLTSSLKHLEYRGYDSAGMVVLNTQQQFSCVRAEGKVDSLIARLQKEPAAGYLGMAHTRWATHGKPSEVNAHPQLSNNLVAVVHNGIIENHDQLRAQLIARGYVFASETDTEVIAHLLHHELKDTPSIIQAIRITTHQLIGAYSLGILIRTHADHLFAVRSGSPLVIGITPTAHYMASDPLALMHLTHDIVYLEEGDIADIQSHTFKIYNSEGKEVTREIHHTDVSHHAAELGDYRHYMQKEIFEQAEAVRSTLENRLESTEDLLSSLGGRAEELLSQTKHLQIVACGSSYHAGYVAKYWLESIAGIACEVEVASEFRYRKRVPRENSLLCVISQSGETADLLAALREAKKEYIGTLAICNVPMSTLTREVDCAFMTRAGVEIGVASTKAFTAQLAALACLTLVFAKNKLPPLTIKNYLNELKELPQHVETALLLDVSLRKTALLFANKHHALFLGRGMQYPIALEGALKLKEISYIHAQAYPAGELKHGPLALVDEHMPVVVCAPHNSLFEKISSNIHEVRARDGYMIILTDDEHTFKNTDRTHLIKMPTIPDWLTPIVYTIPLQLLSYHVAVLKGTDVDKPRNLAKSVTVE